MVQTLNQLALSARSIPLKDLSLKNLSDFYRGLPYRYNSVTDIVSQGGQVKQELLQRLGLEDQLSYQVVFLSTAVAELPVLECLKINGASGGMLSSYLHDLDRELVEGDGELRISAISIAIWQELLSYDEFSFVFPASQNPSSRTSLYMNRVGFRERNLGKLRCFFNGRDQSNQFLEVMQEFIDAIRQTNPWYVFDLSKFKASKKEQVKIAKDFCSYLERRFRKTVPIPERI